MTMMMLLMAIIMVRSMITVVMIFMKDDYKENRSRTIE